MKILKINPDKPDIKKIKYAARIIKKGGVVIFPTDTVYGLAVDATNNDAVRKIYEIKGRDFNKPLPVNLSKVDDIKKYVIKVDDEINELINKYLPGAVSFIFYKKNKLLDNVTCGSNKVSIRVPGCEVALKLIEEVNKPITSTSANKAGGKEPSRVEEIDDEIKEKVDLILDAGSTFYKRASTIIDVTEKPPKIVREGAVKIVIG